MVEEANGEDGGLLGWVSRYGDERSCEERLMRERFPGCRPRKRQCTRCRRQFSVIAGTPMRGSHLPLAKWFAAFWLVARSKRGVSAAGLARQLGVSETTASYLLRRIRGAMAGPLRGGRPARSSPARLRSTTSTSAPRPAGRSGGGDLPAADDMRGRHGGRREVLIRCVPGLSGGDYARFAEERGDALDAAHHVISNFKAYAQGTFHGLRAGSLQGTADEFCWRYNHRGGPVATELAREVAAAAHGGGRQAAGARGEARRQGARGARGGGGARRGPQGDAGGGVRGGVIMRQLGGLCSSERHEHGGRAKCGLPPSCSLAACA